MKQQSNEMHSSFGNQLSVQYQTTDFNNRSKMNSSQASLSANEFIKTVKKSNGRSDESQQSLGIQMGINRVGFKQLKEAMIAEKKGLKKDLIGYKPSDWTLRDQLEARSKKMNPSFNIDGRSTQQLLKYTVTSSWKSYTDLIRHSNLKKYDNDYSEGDRLKRSALSMMKVNSKGVGSLMKINTKGDFQNFSVTAQGHEQQQVYRVGNSITGFKIPVMTSKQTQLADQQNFEDHRQNSGCKSIEEKLFEISKNTNIKTSEKRQQPTQADQNFRNYVDNQVDLLNRLSANPLLKRLQKSEI